MSALTCSVVTLHTPAMQAYTDAAILKKAQQIGALSLNYVNLRSFAVDKHGSVDSQPFGGGDGMVLRPEPLRDALASIETPKKKFVILTSPSGAMWSNALAREWASLRDERHYVMICGRFGGVDQRFIDAYVDAEVSIGDYILSGGELAAMVMMDSMARFVPDVLGHKESAEIDSFSDALDGGLEFPLYTRPQSFEGVDVPAPLLSGDHAAIAKWRAEQAAALTKKRRPDLIK